MALDTDSNFAPSTFSISGMESKAIRNVSSRPVWNPAIRDDSSGISRKISSAKAGVWRQWSSTAAMRQNSFSRCSSIDQGPVPAMSRLAASTPISSDWALLTTQLEEPEGVFANQFSNVTNSDIAMPVLTSIV